MIDKPRYFICNEPFRFNPEKGHYESEVNPDVTVSVERVRRENLPLFSFRIVKINGEPYFQVSALEEYWSVAGKPRIIGERERRLMAQEDSYVFEVPAGAELRKVVERQRMAEMKPQPRIWDVMREQDRV